ncbi:MAG TPA: TetR/AcrR family transcriptional regulator C-terminal domain-containing protein [Streptosporangiaceae bacterium]|nr:TetR/AcrR family transcriptional regulator C-terminal domain-containing protein [Streptosporangiaceae bacterium]
MTSEVPEPPWQRSRRRSSRARRDPITAEAITDAAIKILDSEGLEGLSMRRVADALNTGPASLYWHVGNKDGLLDLVFDQIIGEMDVPPPQGDRWKEQLKQIALSQRATILRHRDLVAISMGRIPMGPHALRYTERVVGVLRAGGVPDSLAVSGYLLLFALVNGFTMDEMAEPVSPAEDDAGAPSPSAVSGYLASLPVDQFPNIVAAAPHFAQWDNDVQFEMLVDLYVDGLAQRAAAAGPATEAGPDA